MMIVIVCKITLFNYINSAIQNLINALNNKLNNKSYTLHLHVCRTIWICTVKVQRSLVHFHSFVVHTFLPLIHRKVVDFRVMRTEYSPWNWQAKLTKCEPHSWDPRQRTTWAYCAQLYNTFLDYKNHFIPSTYMSTHYLKATRYVWWIHFNSFIDLQKVQEIIKKHHQTFLQLFRMIYCNLQYCPMANVLHVHNGW